MTLVIDRERKGKLLTVSVDGAVEYAITILIVDTLLAEDVSA